LGIIGPKMGKSMPRRSCAGTIKRLAGIRLVLLQPGFVNGDASSLEANRDF
jgi:hypothetical protein